MAEPDRFDIADFERLARAGDGAALAMLEKLLLHIEMGGDMVADDGAQSGGAANDAAGAQAMFRRLATAIGDLLADADLTLAPRDADMLAQHNRHLAALFRMAWADGPARVFKRVRGVHGDAPRGDALAKVLAAASPAVADGPDWRQLLARDPDIAAPFFIANFTHRVVLDADAERRRDDLFPLAAVLADVPLRPSALQGLSDAWMLCSYASRPDRHALKGHLNARVRGLIGAAPPPGPAKPNARPTVVVVAEVLRAGHAIFKTYAHFLGQLRGRFRTVLVSLDAHTDGAARALFDDAVTVPVGPGLITDTVNHIKGLSPDVVYYPSVGMTPWTVALCNLRLARVQIASVGHPATTGSDAIDYMVMGHAYLGDEACFTERVMVLASSGALFTPDDEAPPPRPVVRERPDVVRVAVPATPMKLNARFLAICARVAAAAGRAVEYHFFPNLSGIRHRDCAAAIETRLAGAVVHPALGFAEYIERLNECDARFGTFPFGGANTSLDGFRQGLPTLVFEGPEPHSRTDSRFIRLFGLPDWLIAAREAEFEAAALRLIADDEERAAVARAILDAGPDQVLFEREQRRYPTDFADLIAWLIGNHDRVQASPQRVWTVDDRAAGAD